MTNDTILLVVFWTTSCIEPIWSPFCWQCQNKCQCFSDQVIENNCLVSMLTFIYSLTNGQAGKLIFFTFHVGPLYWVAFRIRGWQGSLSCVLEVVTLLPHCPLGPHANLTKCSNSVHCDDSGIPPRIHTLFRPKIYEHNFENNVELTNLWLKY